MGDNNNRDWLLRERARAREVIEARDALLRVAGKVVRELEAQEYDAPIMKLLPELREAIAKAERRTAQGIASEARDKIDAAREDGKLAVGRAPSIGTRSHDGPPFEGPTARALREDSE